MAHVNYKGGVNGNYSNPDNWEVLTPAPKKYYFYGSGYFHQTLKWRDENGKRRYSVPTEHDEIIIDYRCFNFAFRYAWYYRLWYFINRKPLPKLTIYKATFGQVNRLIFGIDITITKEFVYNPGIKITIPKTATFVTGRFPKHIWIVGSLKWKMRVLWNRIKMEIPF